MKIDQCELVHVSIRSFQPTKAIEVTEFRSFTSCLKLLFFSERPQKSCPDPGKAGLLLRNIGTKKSFKPGTKLRYYCPDKFSLKGSRDLVCKKDGTWSAPLPQCIGT